MFQVKCILTYNVPQYHKYAVRYLGVESLYESISSCLIET